jgi:hypothetical protein
MPPPLIALYGRIFVSFETKLAASVGTLQLFNCGFGHVNQALPLSSRLVSVKLVAGRIPGAVFHHGSVWR